ncbi:MAG TPA: alpha/beta fold hydrolase [Streptomyces sp.]|nr:alpha/beta fold hydrolase [Streptomyces sp.]
MDEPFEYEDDTPVVVGMACRFAGSDGLDAYWERLRSARSALGTTDRWPEEEDAAGFAGGFLDGHREFDARFFRISPNEARCMDPQQRLLLQSVQHAVDDAHLTPEDLRDTDCGVFAAALPGDYRNVVARRPDVVHGTHSFLGNAPSTLSGRVSYFYDVHGPSLTLDSACSSSLTALHQAVLNLRAGHCRSAIVGAVSVFSTPEVLRFARRSRMSSPGGTSLPFTDTADGFVPAEGTAAVVVMRHDEARARGLRVHGAVVATASNHNGTTNGLMAPSSAAQARLIAGAYARAGVDPARIAYVETHGTGTPLGDPIEVEGLKSAFRRAGGDGCRIGAVKPLIGHTLVCSGLAGVIKMLLGFRHGTIPPASARDEAASLIDIAPFEANPAPVPWPGDKPLGAVSAFGFTGSNGHVVLCRPPAAGEAAGHPGGRALPFCLSAESPQSLTTLVDRYRTLVASLPDDALWSLSQLMLRRPRYTHRRVVVAGTRDELLSELAAPEDGEGLARLDDEQRDLVSLWRAGDVRALRPLLAAPAALARIALPGYAFEKRSYWVTDTPRTAAEPAVDPALAERLCAELSALLGFGDGPDRVHPGSRIASLGLDSLSAVQLLAPYREKGSPVGSHDLFRHETVADLAAALAGRRPDGRAPGTPRPSPGTGPAARTRWQAHGGSGRPTVLLPPLNSDERAWTQQLPALLRQGRRVYVPSYPGHGGAPFDAAGFSFESLADEVAGFLRDTAGGPADLVGWSLGACVSALTALRHPELVTSLTLVSCAPRYGEDVFERTVELRQELRVHGGLLEAVFDAGGDPAERFTAAAPMEVLHSYYTALSAFDIVGRLPDITAPCLVVRGTEDCVVDAESAASLSRIPGARLREFDHHGHYVPLTAGRAFNETLTAFWAEQPTAFRAGQP